VCGTSQSDVEMGGTVKEVEAEAGMEAEVEVGVNGCISPSRRRREEGEKRLWVHWHHWQC
jgi:hypothetical protein